MELTKLHSGSVRDSSRPSSALFLLDLALPSRANPADTRSALIYSSLAIRSLTLADQSVGSVALRTAWQKRPRPIFNLTLLPTQSLRRPPPKIGGDASAQ